MAKRLVTGILAHVDAGKTTLSEAMLYTVGSIRRLGRVDHGDAFLDGHVQERERGITIFSKQAVLPLGDTVVTLVDTPGHVDFSAEMERTLQILDCAVLVISGIDGVQGHTRTLWRLLESYGVPTFIFVNKMDLSGADRDELMKGLISGLSDACVDFGAAAAERDDALAMCGEEAMEEYLDTGSVSAKTIAELVSERRLFPCWFGSALKLSGVDALLEGIKAYTKAPCCPSEFGARVFKISRDPKGARLTWLKITGGVLRAKQLISTGEGDDRREEKADQLRLYSGEKFQPLDEAAAGMTVAVTGLTMTRPGQGIGFEKDAKDAILEPVLNYRMILPDGTDPHTMLPRLRQLEEEDPMLRILWKEGLREIHVRLMGQVQLEVLERIIQDRFGISVSFDTGNVLYKETIANTVEGVGHFEPLRHYAEVHLLMEPGPRGSGIRLATACPTDRLDLNWQRLIFTHLAEREHPGVLTGSALTDVRITLASGRAHLKHTEGGDFRQATYRAVRQGLMQAECVLLEPFYDFRLEVPPSCVGRAINDLQGMGATVDPPETLGDISVLTGHAPVVGIQGYQQEVAAYTKGLGQLSCALRGYEPCGDPERVIADAGYDPERDTDNPPDSVFCDHGAGFVVKWYDVPKYMHLESCLRPAPRERSSAPASGGMRSAYSGSPEQDKELQAIFERTYGKTSPRAFETRRSAPRTELKESYHIPDRQTGPEYLLVDGYNIIFAWDELKSMADRDLSTARTMLEEILANYRGFRQCEVILVFDAYKVRGNPGSIEKRNGIYVVYTKEAETADAYIEKATYQLRHNRRVRVATSDNLEQVIILGHGALRLPAGELKSEIEEAQAQISRLIERYNQRGSGRYKIGSVIDLKSGEDGSRQ